MSEITTIYTNLAAMAVVVGSVTPTVYNTSALMKTLDTVQTPARVLDPAYGPDRGEFELPYHSGDTGVVYWTIFDVLLWKAQGQDIGPAAVASSLVAYCGAYLEKVRDTRPLVAGGQSEIQAVRPIISYNLEWPRGSGRLFYGVEVELRIMEVLSGA